MPTVDRAAFRPYQTDILFLVIGSNPLPNYVAARLLAREDATLYLLHSAATSAVADRLARRLGQERPDLNFVRFGIPESDGPAIARKVNDIVRPHLAQWSRAAVGLHFTGGTKPMAVYTALALRAAFPAAVFSYLDARTLSLVIDGGDGATRGMAVGRSVRLSLKDVAGLHGYDVAQAAREPRNLRIAQAIRDVHLAPGGLREWRDWLGTWRDGATLPAEKDFPALRPAILAFDDACGGAASAPGLAQALGFKALEECAKYFVGEWLEDCTLDAVARVEDQAGLDDCAAGLLIQAKDRPPFDFDVVATLGYQLFGLSCAATEQKPRAKEHLLEVFTRAGQLGGDEARFASVTLCNDTNVKELERDVSQAWDAVGKIRIFGRQHIPDLSQHLLKWFREANREAP
jgi:hypothetical protein